MNAFSGARRRGLALFFGSVMALGGAFSGACSSEPPVVEGPDAASTGTATGTATTTAPPKPTGTTPPDPDTAKAPVVTSVTPDKALVGDVGPAIVITGNNFVARSVIQLDGAPLATTFVSATELRGAIPSNKLAAVGTLRISVGTAPPGGGASKELTFEVQNPAPIL
ncbi:MAG: IPT/TIG domain-containing protein, partial [Myxococcales bacterium]|nr:IPT/TIG domain-containing protein [Myxococcales bacterium]